ncbi:MAG TPA: aminotransferase class IV [Chitinophagaceae bacterium]|nr:aminotransferase class IV [Chitinophagaceae bacterium]
MNYTIVNGKIQSAEEPSLLVSNRSYRYGHGLFETMKWMNGKIRLADFHFERLFSGLDLLKIRYPKHFTAEKISEEVEKLCIKNQCLGLARVRLSVSRGNGGLFDNDTSLRYVIESWPLSDTINLLNENGLDIGIYTDARKSFDKFANLKSANFLPYAMAAAYAREKNLNDCIVLNQEERVADTTIANIFLIVKDEILTPALSEACIAGTMRKYLILQFKKGGVKIRETEITVQNAQEADEIFLTNAVQGLRWVKRFGDKRFVCKKTAEIYQQFVRTIPI